MNLVDIFWLKLRFRNYFFETVYRFNNIIPEADLWGLLFFLRFFQNDFVPSLIDKMLKFVAVALDKLTDAVKKLIFCLKGIRRVLK
jgi:hypothetical protein